MVVPPSMIAAAPKVFAAPGAAAVTERHWFADVLVAFVLVTLDRKSVV